MAIPRILLMAGMFKACNIAKIEKRSLFIFFLYILIQFFR